MKFSQREVVEDVSIEVQNERRHAIGTSLAMCREFADCFDNLLFNALTITAMTRCGKVALILVHMLVEELGFRHVLSNLIENLPAIGVQFFPSPGACVCIRYGFCAWLVCRRVRSSSEFVTFGVT